MYRTGGSQTEAAGQTELVLSALFSQKLRGEGGEESVF